MTAQDYKITFPYGATSSPYSASHPHRGDDRACPTGTPIVIGGVTIGLTGSTGLTTGPHLHVQEWTGDVANTRKPQNSFVGGTVSATGVGSQWGNYISISIGGWNTTYCHLSQINVSKGQVIGGSNMAETINLDTDRILQHGILARNGIKGRSYALNGSTGKVFEGQQLTNANISAWYLSEEARQWRDTSDANSVNGINAQLDSIAGKDQTIATLTTENANLTSVTTQQAQTITDQQQTINGQKLEISELQDENTALKKQVKDLEAQVAAGGGDITINFNFVGIVLWSIIKSFGYKKG